jgi:molybdopterin/thiamine biosynthesis adenylyltransferase/rhodanese-related sulfurtransferase
VIDTVRAAGLPQLSADELRRYARHLILPGVGPEGQRRLKGARVLLVGVGGLGSPAALYLAAAGVGTLGLVDYDVVEFTNLQRQVLHDTASVGSSKLASAAGRIAAINPAVAVETRETRLTSANALEIIAEYDVVVDGSDNFPTRYLVNDACVKLGRSDVYGSIHRFEGQVSVFSGGPCYRCLYRDPPPPELVPSCAEGGVLGVLPGIVGTLQAAEAIKLVLGAGESLAGRLLLVDALAMRFRELTLERDPDCPVCSIEPAAVQLIDYDAFCGASPATSQRHEGTKMELTAADLHRELGEGKPLLLVDVRQPWEFEICSIGASRLIPLDQLQDRMDEIPPGSSVVTICHTGRRSLQAAALLKAAGIEEVRSLRGGVEGWAVNIDARMARY